MDMDETKQIAKEAAKSFFSVPLWIRRLINPRCECHRCIKEKKLTGGEMFGTSLPLSSCKMILCPTCGNKRCPHASDHRLACTGSNEPGQKGSVYE